MTPQIAFHKVFYRSGEKAILKDLSLEIFPGDYISVVGPSGSGKSTFLKLCCHLISPTEGSILINGADVMKLDPAELRKRSVTAFRRRSSSAGRWRTT